MEFATLTLHWTRKSVYELMSSYLIKSKGTKGKSSRAEVHVIIYYTYVIEVGIFWATDKMYCRSRLLSAQ